MADDNELKPELSLSIFWTAMLVSYVVMLGVLFYVASADLVNMRNEQAGPWLLGGGLAMALLAWRLTPGENRRQTGIPRQMDEAQRQQAMRRITLGAGLAEAPGILGALYYMMSYEAAGFAVLAAVSIVLFLRVKPD